MIPFLLVGFLSSIFALVAFAMLGAIGWVAVWGWYAVVQWADARRALPPVAVARERWSNSLRGRW
jgi:cytoskeletal protein RodZ